MQHINSYSKSYTAKRGPWILVHAEEFSDRSQAVQRERFLKSVAGSREKKELAEKHG
jgi:predicted GIY-YIG superfamily endonuclease